MNCCTIKQECVSCMGTTTYVSEEQKFKLLSDIINYICNHMHVRLNPADAIATTEYVNSAAFAQFQFEMTAAKTTYALATDDHFRDETIKHARQAIDSWDFTLEFRSFENQRLSNYVKLLRQIIGLLKQHTDDVWLLEHDGGRGLTPHYIYNTPRDAHFREHEHTTTTPHAPREAGPIDVESTEAACVCVSALLLELHDLSERDI